MGAATRTGSGAGCRWGSLAVFLLVGCHDFDSLRSEGPRDAAADTAVDAEEADAKISLPCGTTGLADCIRPSFVANRELAVAGGPDLHITVGEHGTWNVDTGELKIGADTITIPATVQAQEEGAPMLSVFSVGTLEVDDGGTLTLVGTNAVAILATGDISLDGVLDASGDEGTGGPGGASSATDFLLEGLWMTSGRPGNRSSKKDISNNPVAYANGGGGGGSNGSRGGSGGPAMAAKIDVATSVTGAAPTSLIGGGAGGVGMCDQMVQVLGGGGGGGVLLGTQGTLRVGVSGVVDLGGAGGRSRASSIASNCGAAGGGGGGGGGAGGTLFADARTVVIEGGIFANGGGGGGGDTGGAMRAAAGDHGTKTLLPAEGGAKGEPVVAGGVRYVGEDGASGSADAGDGASAATATGEETAHSSLASSGGGGGGLGRIVIHSESGEAAMEDGAFSPSGGDLLLVGKAKTFTLE
ncbi:MAG: hypothetical protein R3A78_04435 [Polyangiales bacterium]